MSIISYFPKNYQINPHGVPHAPSNKQTSGFKCQRMKTIIIDRCPMSMPILVQSLRRDYIVLILFLSSFKTGMVPLCNDSWGDSGNTIIMMTNLRTSMIMCQWRDCFGRPVLPNRCLLSVVWWLVSSVSFGYVTHIVSEAEGIPIKITYH